MLNVRFSIRRFFESPFLLLLSHNKAEVSYVIQNNNIPVGRSVWEKAIS